MSRIIHDIKILDNTVAPKLRDDEEMIRLVDPTVATLAIPPRLAVAIDNSVRLRGDGNVGSADCDHIVVCFRESKGSRSSKSYDRTGSQLAHVQGRVARNVDAVKRDGGA